jgi:23S rRNA (adenine2030-N6)-methyltransferase
VNYRHAFHAGNFADVVKHIALVSIVLHLKKKPAPFAVIDTHAGRGLYNLGGEDALRTREAACGIEKLGDLKHGPEALTTYLDIVRGFGVAQYPGSPLIAAKLLRPQDRLLAFEKHPEDAAALAVALVPFAKARAQCADGYRRLIALLPPPERRALVLIDPPYEAPDEFAQVAHTVKGALDRFATGIYLIWMPIKSAAEADALGGEVVLAGARKLLRLDIEIARNKDDDRLAAAGLLIVNPPFGLEEEMRAALGLVAPLLGTGAPARWRLDWLAGAP